MRKSIIVFCAFHFMLSLCCKAHDYSNFIDSTISKFSNRLTDSVTVYLSFAKGITVQRNDTVIGSTKWRFNRQPEVRHNESYYIRVVSDSLAKTPNVVLKYSVYRFDCIHGDCEVIDCGVGEVKGQINPNNDSIIVLEHFLDFGCGNRVKDGN
jgi:hypothetical protein